MIRSVIQFNHDFAGTIKAIKSHRAGGGVQAHIILDHVTGGWESGCMDDTWLAV